MILRFKSMVFILLLLPPIASCSQDEPVFKLVAVIYIGMVQAINCMKLSICRDKHY